MIYDKPGAVRKLSIPDKREVAPGTLRDLIDIMGLTVDDFLALARK
ncbi:MAG: hypothetical protein ACM3S1_10245 [Hyphomicrobiales bacterium]